MAPSARRQPLPPQVAATLDGLLAGLQSILSDNLEGLYLVGSLAMDDFTPGRSDIDFIAVTRQEMDQEVLQQLSRMHLRLVSEQPTWGYELEGGYFPIDTLRQNDLPATPLPHVERGGNLKVEPLDSGWLVQRHILREFGIDFYGPESQSFVAPVGPAELRQASRALLYGWWAEELETLCHLNDPDYQAAAEYRAYAVLTMCRMLYTQAQGEIVAKPEAARWALENIPGLPGELVTQALGWRHSDSFDHLEAVRALVRFTLAYFGQSPSPPGAPGVPPAEAVP